MDEKLRVLKMVEEGTITAEEAAELMEAMQAQRSGSITTTTKSCFAFLLTAPPAIR